MKSSSRLCPQCQRPLLSNEMYCNWCKTYAPQDRPNATGTFPPPPPPYYAEARPNTTGTFPPPPPQYPELSGQNGIQTGMGQGEKILVPQPTGKKSNRPLLVGGVLVVCLLVIGSFWFGKMSGTSGNPGNTGISGAATSTQAASTSIATTTSVEATPTSVASATPTEATPTIAPTPLTTVSLSSPQLPLTIACVGCSYPQLTVVLKSITVDKVGQSTNWVFAISNTGRISCNDLSFYVLQLTDPYGTRYLGKGQAANNFALGAEQSLQVNAVFGLLPTTGTQYTLKLEIFVGYCVSSSVNTYATQNFTFA